MNKKYIYQIMILSVCLSIVVFNSSFCRAADTLLGITWGNSSLVSFDPYSGQVIAYHTQLNQEAFRGLAYNSNTNMLYALSQSSWSLYQINPMNLDVTKIGNLDINSSLSWGQDIGGLTYNPTNNTFYTTINHWDSGYTNIWSELASVDISTGHVTSVGPITNGFVDSISYDQQSGNMYGYALYGSGSWDSQYKTHFVQINPDTAAMTDLFETPYHAIMGLAKDPEENIFFSWVNWTDHYYAEVIPDTGTVTLLGMSDPVGVSSDAMLYRNFYVKEAPFAITIDIKPGNDLNSINLKSRGSVSVAILTTADFDARNVDRTTVKFAGASPLPKWKMMDVDGDVDMDMILKFNIQDLVDLNSSSTEGILTGKASIGTDLLELMGKDAVSIVTKGKK